MTIRPAVAELVDSREILPGQRLLSMYAPAIAAGARAGQYLQIRTDDLGGLVLRRPCPLNTADPATGVISIQVGTSDRGMDWFRRLRPGDPLDATGPLGRPFEVDPRSRHLLLIAVGGLGMARLRLLVDESLRAGRQVTVLFGAESARDVYPSSLLPDEVEYVIATDDGSVGQRGSVTDLVAGYESWADQAFASGPDPMLGALTRLAAGRRERLGVAKLGRKRGGGKGDPVGSTAARRKAFLQVVLKQTVGCASGTCLGCVVMGASGAPQRVCREGPVFVAEELAWDRQS